MYKIIGQDGREYGPVSAEQLRRWIAENRVEIRTPVFTDSAQDWTFVGLLPEFAGHFPGAAPHAPPPIAPPKPGQSTAGQTAKTNSFAVAGLVCGILSVTLCLCCGGMPFNIFGLLISENPQLHEGRGLAIAGIILSAASFLLLLLSVASGHTNINFNGGQF
jgi:hypothetical protein